MKQKAILLIITAFIHTSLLIHSKSNTPFSPKISKPKNKTKKASNKNTTRISQNAKQICTSALATGCAIVYLLTTGNSSKKTSSSIDRTQTEHQTFSTLTDAPLAKYTFLDIPQEIFFTIICGFIDDMKTLSNYIYYLSNQNIKATRTYPIKLTIPIRHTLGEDQEQNTDSHEFLKDIYDMDAPILKLLEEGCINLTNPMFYINCHKTNNETLKPHFGFINPTQATLILYKSRNSNLPTTTEALSRITELYIEAPYAKKIHDLLNVNTLIKTISENHKYLETAFVHLPAESLQSLKDEASNLIKDIDNHQFNRILKFDL